MRSVDLSAAAIVCGQPDVVGRPLRRSWRRRRQYVLATNRAAPKTTMAAVTAVNSATAAGVSGPRPSSSSDAADLRSQRSHVAGDSSLGTPGQLTTPLHTDRAGRHSRSSPGHRNAHSSSASDVRRAARGKCFSSDHAMLNCALCG